MREGLAEDAAPLVVAVTGSGLPVDVGVEVGVVDFCGLDLVELVFEASLEKRVFAVLNFVDTEEVALMLEGSDDLLETAEDGVTVRGLVLGEGL